MSKTTNLFIALAILGSRSLAQDPPDPAAKSAQPERGLVTTTEHAAPGYTLMAPLTSTSTFLVDLAGNVVHEWKSDAPPGNAVYLLENGDLLRTERVDNPVFFGGGQGGRIREIAADDKVVWEYVGSDEHHCLHHDVRRLPNGHVLAIAWERKTKEEALAAGRDPKLVEDDEMWPDEILEVEPARPTGGRVVWEWHAWDHLVQDLDAAKKNHGDVALHPERIDINADRDLDERRGPDPHEMERLRGIGYAGDAPPRRGPPDGGPGGPGGPGGGKGGDWTHVNSVDYRADLDLILLSTPNLGEIWVIDHSTTSAEAATSKGGRYGHGGDLLVRWGNPRVHKHGVASDQKLFGQHDATWIASGLPGAGHILVFNNGTHTKRGSSVDEIVLPLDAERLTKGFDSTALAAVQVAWTYTTPRMLSEHISGAQRFANGNTLVCAGETGRLLEVTQKGDVAWEFLNPHKGDQSMVTGGPRRGGRPGGPRPPNGAPDDVKGAGGPPDAGNVGISGRAKGDADVPTDGRPRGPGRGGPGGHGPFSPFGLFRAERYAPEFAGVVKLLQATKPAQEPSSR